MTGASEGSVSGSLSAPQPHHHQQQHQHHHHLSLKSLRSRSAYIPAKDDPSYVPRTAGDAPPSLGGSKGTRRQECVPAEASRRTRGKEATKAIRRKQSNVVRSYSCECVRGKGDEDEEDEEAEEEEGKVAGPQGDAGGAGLSVPAAPGADGRVCLKGYLTPRCSSSPQHRAPTTPQHGQGGRHSCVSPVRGGVHVDLKERGLFCDERQKVQRVVKVGGGEIQVEVISSELVVRREPRQGSCGDGCGVVNSGGSADERPAKKKRKFIIILKGLLSKSKRSEKKKCVEGESGRESVGGGESDAVTHTCGDNNNKRDARCGGGDGRGEANGGVRGQRQRGGGEAGGRETRLDAAHKHEGSAAAGDESGGDHSDAGSRKGGRASGANSTSRHEANDNTGSGGIVEGGWENSAPCLGTQEQLTLLYHAALTQYSHVENGWREDARESRPSSPDPDQSCATLILPDEGSREETLVGDEPLEEGLEFPPDAQVTFPREPEPREEPLHPQQTASTCEEQNLINNSPLLGDASKRATETPSPEDQECLSQPLSGDSESHAGGDQGEACPPHIDTPSESVSHLSEKRQDVTFELSVSPAAPPCQGVETPGREATRTPAWDTSSVHPLLGPAWPATDTACEAVSGRDCAAPSPSNSNQDAADVGCGGGTEHNSDDLEEKECAGLTASLSCPPNLFPTEGRSDPAEGQYSDSESDADQSESDSDSSVDYDIPSVDESIYDPQFDPYFYQGSISLEHVPDDQPIDYPCPYDANGDFLCGRQFTPHFSYLDHWSGSVVNAPGDLYRSQSQPEAVTQDQPLDGDAPLHAFLSQPIPSQVPPGFPLENSLLRPRKQGEFSSLWSFGGSQLYTITEEAECDDQYDDFYSRRNYSESNLYFRGAEDLYNDPYYIRPELYYGDSDSDSTLHSESLSERDSTETLDQDAHCREIPESHPAERTSQLSLTDSFELDVSEQDYQGELVTTESEECLDADGRTHQDSPRPESECQGGEYPDEFFLFCSEAEVTGVDVMESVDVLPCNGGKEDFTYFKVESKTCDRSSPVDHEFLLESYNYKTTMSGRSSSPGSDLALHDAWEAGHSDGPGARKGPSSHVYQNIPINSRLSRSNPNLTFASDEVDQGCVAARPIYQNVPVPAKRHNAMARDTGRGLDNPPSRDTNSNYYEDWAHGHALQTMSPYMNVPHNGHGSNASLHNLNSSKSSSSLSSSLSDGLDRVVSNGHSEDQRSSSSSVCGDLRASPDLRYVGLSLAPSSGILGVGSATGSSGSFTAYASNTSLDHDTFSKTSKIYKWNGSSSVSDLTSLSRDLSSTSSSLNRGSASACDLTQVSGDESWGNEAPLGETSYAAWCARVQDDDGDDQDFMPSLSMKEASPFVFTPHQSKYNSIGPFSSTAGTNTIRTLVYGLAHGTHKNKRRSESCVTKYSPQ
ncbi:uncharacterized protein LOC126984256 [Eriocheir sinensis]|uniref:uncharacterized protein LOC126984256 n=1 Tax=Eriocheir sinensis TaxID=95602 RepID=UPI0021C8C457|nr:uncharacterized protein LOC126984256 [Eriocheir sinensis]XP_050693834.1 uncharacterized protein LOC126984256 [Eriocheir sinensis]